MHEEVPTLGGPRAADLLQRGLHLAELAPATVIVHAVAAAGNEMNGAEITLSVRATEGDSQAEINQAVLAMGQVLGAGKELRPLESGVISSVGAPQSDGVMALATIHASPVPGEKARITDQGLEKARNFAEFVRELGKMPISTAQLSFREGNLALGALYGRMIEDTSDTVALLEGKAEVMRDEFDARARQRRVSIMRDGIFGLVVLTRPRPW